MEVIHTSNIMVPKMTIGWMSPNNDQLHITACCMVGFTTCLFGAITLLWVATTYEKTSQKKGAQLSSLRIYFGALWLQVSRCLDESHGSQSGWISSKSSQRIFCCSSTYLCFFSMFLLFACPYCLKTRGEKKPCFSYCWWFRSHANLLIWKISHKNTGFIHPRCLFGISEPSEPTKSPLETLKIIDLASPATLKKHRFVVDQKSMASKTTAGGEKVSRLRFLFDPFGMDVFFKKGS